jgi:hypothetical protein
LIEFFGIPGLKGVLGKSQESGSVLPERGKEKIVVELI